MFKVVPPSSMHSRGATVEFVANRLRSGIISGRYLPGKRLIENDLTQEYGVSRPTVREALQRLGSEGLIEMVPNRGAMVRRLTFEEADELFEIRIALEVLAVRRAAKNIEVEDTAAEFREAIAGIWDSRLRDPRTYLDENESFHEAIFVASGNRKLAKVSHELRLPLILIQMSGALSRSNLDHSVEHHRRIASAILDGDPDRAEQCLRAHLDEARFLLQTVPEDFPAEASIGS